MANKLKITKNSATTDKQVSPILVGGQPIGGTGGLTSQTGSQIAPQVYCTDGTRSQTLTLVNNPTLAAGQMNILINLNTAAANIAAANVAGGATSATVTYDTRTTVTGPVTFPRVGDYVIWTSPSANIGSVVQVTAVNGTTNFTIGTTGNVAASTGTVLTTSTYATRITNRTVTDYNSRRFFYRLAVPTTTYVQVYAA